jgi:uncharacterized protein YkwD
MFRVVALSLALAATIAPGAWATQVVNVRGDVLVNKGDGFKPATNNLPLEPGAQIQVLEGSAQVEYGNGYVASLGPHQLTIVLVDPPESGSGASYAVTGGYAYEAIAAVNDYRHSNHRQPLTLDGRLMVAASALATDNANHDRKSHAGSDGADLGKRLLASGYDYRVAAEMVETRESSLAKLFDSWKKSAEGKRNMLVPDVTQMGFAQEYRENTDSKFFWVLVVAAPR